MNNFKNKLIFEATETYSTIYPCGSKHDFDDCFTVNGDQLIFWFNTEDQSTHVVSMHLDTMETV